MEIVMEQTDICVNEPYAISVDAPPGTIVIWKCIDAPFGVLEDDVEFTIQGNRFTDVILPPWKGCYLITARIKTPK
jgi:hypothetical protein